jgi:hypothetical protein
MQHDSEIAGDGSLGLLDADAFGQSLKTRDCYIAVTTRKERLLRCRYSADNKSSVNQREREQLASFEAQWLGGSGTISWCHRQLVAAV